MMIDATHHSAGIINAGRRIDVPGSVGTQKTKSPLHKARDRLFNEALAKVWVNRIQKTDTRFRVILKILPDLVAPQNTP